MEEKNGQKGNTAKLLRNDMVRRFLLQKYVNILFNRKQQRYSFFFFVVFFSLSLFFFHSNPFFLFWYACCTQKKRAQYIAARFWSKWSKPNLNGHGSYSLLSKHHRNRYNLNEVRARGMETQEKKRTHSRKRSPTTKTKKSCTATVFFFYRRVKFMITWKWRELSSDVFFSFYFLLIQLLISEKVLYALSSQVIHIFGDVVGFYLTMEMYWRLKKTLLWIRAAVTTDFGAMCVMKLTAWTFSKRIHKKKENDIKFFPKTNNHRRFVHLLQEDLDLMTGKT